MRVGLPEWSLIAWFADSFKVEEIRSVRVSKKEVSRHKDTPAQKVATRHQTRQGQSRRRFCRVTSAAPTTRIGHGCEPVAPPKWNA